MLDVVYTRIAFNPLLAGAVLFASCFGLEHASAQQKLYWSAGIPNGSIRRADLTGANQAVTWPAQSYTGIALDLSREWVYWGVNINGIRRIRRGSLDGVTGPQDMVLVASQGQPHAMAIDPATGSQGTVYWVTGDTPSGSGYSGRIYSADIATGNYTVLAQTSNTFNGIALDLRPDQRKLYYGHNSSGGKVTRAELDGSNPQVIAGVGTIIRSLAVDTINGHIYAIGISQAHLQPDVYWIRRINLDGTDLVTILDSTTGALEQTSNSSIAVDPKGQNIYWYERLDSSASALRRCDYSGNNVETLLSGSAVGGDAVIALDLDEDCNANGVRDNLDILGGSSEDCNTNGTPDECDLGGVLVLDGGIPDNFAQPSEPATPGPELLPLLGCTSGLRDFDTLSYDRCFGHTFSELPKDIRSATLEIRLRTDNGADACNDTIALQASTSSPTMTWGRRIGTGGSFSFCAGPAGLLPTVWTAGSDQTFDFDLDALPNEDGTTFSVLPLLNSDHRLDILVKDDTGVDYCRLTVVYGSQDCNSNDTPDECESDCDGDGLIDDCDQFNNNCPDATPVTDGVWPFTTACATTDGSIHGACSGQIDKDIWFLYTPSCHGTLTASTCNQANFDTQIAIYEEAACPVDATRLLGCSDNNAGACQSGTTFLEVPVYQDSQYLVRIGGKAGASGEGFVSLTCAPLPACPTCSGSAVFNWPFVFTGAIASGAPNGVPWSWKITSTAGAFVDTPPVAVSGIDPMDPNDDLNADGTVDNLDISIAFANSVNDYFSQLGCDTDRTDGQFQISARSIVSGIFAPGLSVSSNCEFDLASAARLTPATPNCCMNSTIPFFTCSFNPVMEVQPLSGADCNRNGLDDWIDVIEGTSFDANQNLIPDECEQPTGDLNCDGVANIADLPALVQAILDPVEYAAQYPGCDRARVDFNGDGDYDGKDIQGFVTLLRGP